MAALFALFLANTVKQMQESVRWPQSGNEGVRFLSAIVAKERALKINLLRQRLLFGSERKCICSSYHLAFSFCDRLPVGVINVFFASADRLRWQL